MNFILKTKLLSDLSFVKKIILPHELYTFNNI